MSLPSRRVDDTRGGWQDGRLKADLSVGTVDAGTVHGTMWQYRTVQRTETETCIAVMRKSYYVVKRHGEKGSPPSKTLCALWQPCQEAG